MYEEREMSLEESFSNDISSQYSWLLQGLFSRRVLWVSLGTPYNMQLQKKKKNGRIGCRHAEAFCDSETKIS